jgi:hypothetical protein
MSGERNKRIIYQTKEEWRHAGVRFFGDNYACWLFVCPSCGNIATPAEFKQYRSMGAGPFSATQECIGLYTGASCTWTSYGPIEGPSFVHDDDRCLPIFNFYEENLDEDDCDSGFRDDAIDSM